MKDEIGIRMKNFYEFVPKARLMRRTPVIVRIDGKAFHTFTRGFVKPFDDILIETMQETMRFLCTNIQGCVFGYTQSDEISLLLIDFKELDSDAYFDYEIQKICSVTASMATLNFNRVFCKKVATVKDGLDEKLYSTYKKAIDKGAMFDSRCFNIPREEVTNYFYWRQIDASRNSVQMVGHVNFSQRELQKKSCNMIQDMLFERKGINWNDFSTTKKRGSCCIQKLVEVSCRDKNETILRNKWIIDNEIPIFKGEDRDYIERFVNFS